LIYLSGAVRPQLLGVPTLGVMLTPRMGNRPELNQTPWAADTGCYNQGDCFRLDRYLTWLESLRCHQATCLFATAPDVVGDAAATWERSVAVLPQLRARGYPAALVGQDGLERMAIDWIAFDCLFIGGTTRWKLSEVAWQLGTEAKRRGKHVHLGRVNSRRRLLAAATAGYDSADGTYIAFGPDRNQQRVRGWLQEIAIQAALRF